MKEYLKESEQMIIDFAREKNLSPEDMICTFQTALLNIAGWICECKQYSNAEYEQFMFDYVDQIKKAVERRFRRHE